MKIFCCFFIALVLCLVPIASAQSNTASSQSNPKLLLDIHVNPVFVANGEVKYDDEKDEEVKYHVSFELAIKNTGADQYQLSRTIHKLWTVVVYQKDPQKTLKWDWTGDESKITTLLPGQELHATADWDALNDAKSGVYTVTATFGDTGRQVTAEFTLPPPIMSAKILLTGRLMGYYRLPDRQLFTDSGNCIAAETRASPDAVKFFHDFPYDKGDHQVRVGTGDNFAPNYYARSFFDPPPAGQPGSGKDLYYWDTLGVPFPHWESDPLKLNNLADVRQGYGTIPTDNVACFLSRAHYDAIVPGTLDFHYGPERLRELARFLATIPEKENDPNFQPVRMLAANMMIKTSWVKDHSPVPDSAKPPLPFVTKFLQRLASTSAKPECSLEVTNIGDGDFVFPWLQTVRIEAKGCDPTFTVPDVSLCEAPAGNPDAFLNDQKTCKNPRPLSLENDVTEGKPSTRKLTYDLMPRDFATPADFENPPSTSSPQKDRASVLKPGSNYAVCVFGPQEISSVDPSTPYCVRFSVYTPFFQYPDWPQQGRAKGDYKNPDLYVVKNDKVEDAQRGLTPVVIFGIVDPQMLENVGADNDAWQNVRVPVADLDSRKDTWDKQYKTQIFIADPVQTLTDLQDFFERDYAHQHGGKKFHGMRVLLAQMPPYKVKQLAEHLPKELRFDVIVSAADDGLATPNQSMKVKPVVLSTHDAQLGLNNGALATPASFMVVPPTHDQAENRWVQARTLTVESDGSTYWKYSLRGRPIPVKVSRPGGMETMAERFWSLVYDNGCKAGNHYCREAWLRPHDDERKSSDMAAIQQLTLWYMLQKTRADVALLQEKDFYSHGLQDYITENCTDQNVAPLQTFACGPQKEPKFDLQQILERIVWKGDFIETRSVTGSVLKAILKESDQFAKAEKPGGVPTGEPGRALVTLGMRPDPDNRGEYLIDGKPIDPTALYTVATSDYIALGDTGYPELGKPPVGDPDPPAMPKGKVQKISALVCDELVNYADALYFTTNCDRSFPAEEFFDRVANKKPEDSRAGNTNLRKFYAWMFLRRPLGQRSDHSRNLPSTTWPEAIQTAMQKRAEDDPDWKWSVDKLSVGFAGLTHTDTTETLSQKFGGVLNSQVNANHFHSWDWDADSKLTFYHPRADWFLGDTLEYSSNFIAQVGAPRSETQTRNRFDFDGGSYIHLLHESKELPQFSLVLSGHFETQAGGVITNLGLNPVPPATSAATLTFNQGRILFLVGRPGLRWENRKSYIEAGLQGGSTLNAIRQFNILVTPGGATVPCVLEASVSLTNCINAFNQNNPTAPVTGSSKVAVLRSPQDRYGAYWKIRMIVPINPLISYKFEDRSDYFFLSSGDNSADTRFLHELTNTVKFKVFPNLSFEPTYTIFLYENKLDYNFLLQQQFSIKINYSFDLSNWHEKNRQLKYAKAGSQ